MGTAYAALAGKGIPEVAACNAPFPHFVSQAKAADRRIAGTQDVLGNPFMFNVRPDVPWIRFRPEPAEDDPPGFRMVAALRPDLPRDEVGFGSFGHDAGIRGAPAGKNAYRTEYLPLASDPTYGVPPLSRYPTQETFDELARIYAGFRGGRLDLFQRPEPGGSPQSSNPSAVRAGRLGGSGFNPERPPLSVPQRASYLPNTEGEQVLSDAASDGGLRDGQQYAQHRPPLAVGGVKGISLDEAGRNVLIPDKPTNPIEELRPRGYPKPPDDPGNGSAFVKKLRENYGYGPNRPNYHRYEFKDPLCDLGTPGCSVEAAYDASLLHAVPGGPPSGKPIQHEQVSSASFKGVPGGRVQTFTDPGSGSIVNRTLLDHQFHDGYVQRQIVVENGKVYVRTFGEGNNTDPQRSAANNVMARSAFEESTARMRAALRPPEPLMGGKKWPR